MPSQPKIRTDGRTIPAAAMPPTSPASPVAVATTAYAVDDAWNSMRVIAGIISARLYASMLTIATLANTIRSNGRSHA